jgi:hypothetical protein
MLTRRPAAASCAVLLAFATACGTATTGPPTAPAGSPQTSALEQILATIGADGRVSKNTAVQAFALAFGNMPGVTSPPGHAEDIPSGSGPLRWTIGHLAELSPGQRQRVLTIVQQHGTATVRVAALRESSPPNLLVADGETQKYQQFVTAADAAFSKRLGVPPLPTTVTLLDRPDPGDGSYAFADAHDAGNGFSGPAASCAITVNPRTRSAGDTVVSQVVHHEVFHCFEAAMYPDLLRFYVGDPWLIEGAAEWASATVSGPDSIVGKRWTLYFATPGRSLLARSYDAIGFFSHLDAHGESPWSHLQAAMSADAQGGGAAAVPPMINGDPAVLDTWATGILRDSTLGADYDTIGPGITADRTHAPLSQLGPGGAAQGSAVAYANSVSTVDIEAEVAVVGAGPHARLHSTTAAGFDSRTPTATYCTKTGGCTCPAGSAGADTTFTTLPAGPYYMTADGGDHGSGWAVATYSLADYCGQQALDSCLLGTWNLVTPLQFPPSLLTHLRLEGGGSIAVSFARNGIVTGDLDRLPTFVSTDPSTPLVIRVGGAITARYQARRGVVRTSNADAAGVTETVTVNGQAINFPAAQLLSILGQGAVSFVTYRCTASRLEADNPYVGTQVFAR